MKKFIKVHRPCYENYEIAWLCAYRVLLNLIDIHKKSHWLRAYHMQGNILQCYPVILPSQVILPFDVTWVSAFLVLGNILQCYPVKLLSGDVIAVSAVAVVRIWYNKRIVALVQG